MPDPPPSDPARGAATVLLLATAYRSGPWAARALRDAGHRVVAADAPGGGRRSCATPRPLRHPDPRRDHEAFVDWVAATCRSEAVDVVLPVSEDAARALSPAADRIPAALAGPDARQYAALCDKSLLAATCAAAGVAHPVTVVVPPGAPRPGAWPALPSVVKPGTSGEAVRDVPAAVVVRCPSERDAAVAALCGRGVPAIVQERLTGERWSVHGVRFRDAFLGTALSVHATYPRAAGTSSRMRSVVPPPRLLCTVGRLLAAVDYRGPASLNLFARDGDFVVHDVNLRLSASIGLSIRSGLDVPSLSVAAALGADAPRGLRGRSVRYVRTDGELRAALDALRDRRAVPEGPLRPVAALVGAALSPGAVLDPSPVDPVWVCSSAVGAAVHRLRAALRG